MFLQQLITGLSVGSIYALMAVGYSLIYSLLNFTNFAHGASVLIGAYVGYFYISSVADNVLMAVVCSTFFGAVLAALIERIAYQPLLDKGVKRIYLLIAGLGISIIGENLISRLDKDTLEYRLLYTQMLRNRNRVADAVLTACEYAELFLAQK